MKIGDLEIDLVSDGSFQVDAGGPFGLVPRALYSETFQPEDDNTIPMALTCMLVRSRGKTILIDTGLGDKLSPAEERQWGLRREQGGLQAHLRAKGVSTDEVDLVINTHLHADHCGGNTVGEGEDLGASFPRAEYWVQRIEWAQASHPDARTRGTYFSKNFAPLLAQGRLRLLHGDVQVTDQVHCVVTPGHTRGHQSVLLRSGEWRGLFLADMASYAVHMERLAWLTAYDVLPLENLRSKQRWQEWALEHDAWLFVEHDPLMPVVRLVQKDGRLQVVPLQEAADLIADLPKRTRRRE